MPTNQIFIRQSPSCQQLKTAKMLPIKNLLNPATNSDQSTPSTPDQLSRREANYVQPKPPPPSRSNFISQSCWPCLKVSNNDDIDSSPSPATSPTVRPDGNPALNSEAGSIMSPRTVRSDDPEIGTIQPPFKRVRLESLTKQKEANSSSKDEDVMDWLESVPPGAGTPINRSIPRTEEDQGASEHDGLERIDVTAELEELRVDIPSLTKRKRSPSPPNLEFTPLPPTPLQVERHPLDIFLEVRINRIVSVSEGSICQSIVHRKERISAKQCKTIPAFLGSVCELFSKDLRSTGFNPHTIHSLQVHLPSWNRSKVIKILSSNGHFAADSPQEWAWVQILGELRRRSNPLLPQTCCGSVKVSFRKFSPQGPTSKDSDPELVQEFCGSRLCEGKPRLAEPKAATVQPISHMADPSLNNSYNLEPFEIARPLRSTLVIDVRILLVTKGNTVPIAMKLEPVGENHCKSIDELLGYICALFSELLEKHGLGIEMVHSLRLQLPGWGCRNIRLLSSEGCFPQGSPQDQAWQQFLNDLREQAEPSLPETCRGTVAVAFSKPASEDPAWAKQTANVVQEFSGATMVKDKLKYLSRELMAVHSPSQPQSPITPPDLSLSLRWSRGNSHFSNTVQLRAKKCSTVEDLLQCITANFGLGQEPLRLDDVRWILYRRPSEPEFVFKIFVNGSGHDKYRRVWSGFLERLEKEASPDDPQSYCGFVKVKLRSTEQNALINEAAPSLQFPGTFSEGQNERDASGASREVSGRLASPEVPCEILHEVVTSAANPLNPAEQELPVPPTRAMKAGSLDAKGQPSTYITLPEAAESLIASKVLTSGVLPGTPSGQEPSEPVPQAKRPRRPRNTKARLLEIGQLPEILTEQGRSDPLAEAKPAPGMPSKKKGQTQEQDQSANESAK